MIASPNSPAIQADAPPWITRRRAVAAAARDEAIETDRRRAGVAAAVDRVAARRVTTRRAAAAGVVARARCRATLARPRPCAGVARRPRRRRRRRRRAAVGRSVVPAVGAAVRRRRGVAAADLVGRRRADLLAGAAVAAGAAAAGHAARRRSRRRRGRTSAPPQSASATQPQRPSVRHWLPASSGRHCGLFAAPGTHSSHFFLVGSQTSGASQSVSKRHCTQCPSGPPLRSQCGSGARQSASVWHIAPEHWPTPFMMSRQLWPVGQPLRGAGPQPGTQKPPAPLQIRPESAAPQERSSDAPAQPQTPRSATQTGFTPPHRVAFVAVHSVQAPRSGPSAGRPGAPDRAARRAVGRARHAGAGRHRADRGDAAAVAVVEAGDAHADARRGVAARGGGRAVGDVGGRAGGAGAARQADRRRRAALGVGGAGAAGLRRAVADRLRRRRTRRSVRQPTQVAGHGVADGRRRRVQRVAFVAEHWPQAPAGCRRATCRRTRRRRRRRGSRARIGSHTGLAPRAVGVVEALDADADRRVAERASRRCSARCSSAEHSPQAPRRLAGGRRAAALAVAGAGAAGVVASRRRASCPRTARSRCRRRRRRGRRRRRASRPCSAAAFVAEHCAARARRLAGRRRAAAVAVGGAGAAGVRCRVAHGRRCRRTGRRSGRRRRCPRRCGRAASRPCTGVALVAEHWPQAPRRLAGGRRAAALAVAGAAAAGVERRRRTSGDAAGQSASARQVTQLPLGAWQSGLAPVHSAAFVAEHWPQAPLDWQAGVDAAALAVAGAGAADVGGDVADRRHAAALGVGVAVHAGAARDVARGHRARCSGSCWSRSRRRTRPTAGRRASRRCRSRRRRRSRGRCASP